MIHPHEIEERDFGRGPLLWDADPEVCCAAFQLGACVHTEGYFPEADEVGLAESFEGFDDYDEDDDAAFWGGKIVSDAEMAALVGGEEEPF